MLSCQCKGHEFEACHIQSKTPCLGTDTHIIECSTKVSHSRLLRYREFQTKIIIHGLCIPFILQSFSLLPRPLYKKVKVTFCFPCLMLWVYISKLVPYDQYLASFDHELENQGCILFCIDAYAANHEAA